MLFSKQNTDFWDGLRFLEAHGAQIHEIELSLSGKPWISIGPKRISPHLNDACESAHLSANLGGEALMHVNVCRQISYIVLFLIISGKLVKSTTITLWVVQSGAKESPGDVLSRDVPVAWRRPREESVVRPAIYDLPWVSFLVMEQLIT